MLVINTNLPPILHRFQDIDIIVVKFEEINLKFEKVQDIIKFEKVRKSSRSTCNNDCYRKTLSCLNSLTLLSFMQYNAVQEGSDYTP